jgi:hypothetical protein
VTRVEVAPAVNAIRTSAGVGGGVDVGSAVGVGAVVLADVVVGSTVLAGIGVSVAAGSTGVGD